MRSSFFEIPSKSNVLKVSIITTIALLIGITSGWYSRIHYEKTLKEGEQRIRAEFVNSVMQNQQIPIKRIKEHNIWAVNAKVNEKFTGRFMIDTGSSITMVSPEFAKTIGTSQEATIGLKGLSEKIFTPAATIKTIRIGNRTRKNLRIAIKTPPFTDIDGILGTDFLKDFTIILKFKDGFLLLQ